MDNYNCILEQSVNLYQQLFTLFTEAIANATANSFESLPETTKAIGVLMNQIEATDKKLFTLCQDPESVVDQDLWTKRENLMQKVLRYHNEQLPYLSSILAVKRSELEKIRSGRRGMSCYHSGQKQSGKQIEGSY